MKIATNIYFVIFFSFLSTNLSKAEILFKDREDIAKYTFKMDCPNKESESIKIKYLCALKGIGKEETKLSFDTMKMLASENVSDAKYSLYTTREITGLDQKTAIFYLEEAAKDGLPAAQLRMAEIYQSGEEDVQQDYKLAFFWLEKAASNGEHTAMRRIAKYYFSGTAVKKDLKRGFNWINKLYIDSGRDFDDWGLLGTIYEEGIGTEINLTKAYMCYDIEGTAGIEEKARIAPKMTAEQRAEGLRLSHEWQEKNHVYTMQYLGLSRQSEGSYR